MNDYWRRNRETEDTELMMTEHKRTAIFFGNRVDARVHALVVKSQKYLARLKIAHTQAHKTYTKGEKVVKVWNLISHPIQKKVLRRLHTAKVQMVIRKTQAVNENDTEYLRIMGLVNTNFSDPGPKVNVESANASYQKELDNRTDQLSQIVTKIQEAYDLATVNNNKAKKLLSEEIASRQKGFAAKKVLMGETKFTNKIRKDEAHHFPALPADITNH